MTSFSGPELQSEGLHALASLPELVSFQGLLTSPSTGVPVPDGLYTITFRVFDVPTGGTSLWAEIQDVDVNDGLFHVLLGSDTALTATVFNGTPRYLEVKVGTNPPMMPRQRFVSVPYAFHSETADSANSADVANDVSCSGCVDQSELAAGAGGVPSGAILLSDGGACPAGYTRLASYDDKFLVASDAAGTTGGADAHTHGAGTYSGQNHTHSVPFSGWTGENINGQRGQIVGWTTTNLAAFTADNTTGPASQGAITGTSASADSRPAFRTILLCKKN